MISSLAVSSFTDDDLKIDKEFLEACLSIPKRERNEGPIYSIPTSASVTDLSLKRLSLTESGEGMSRADLSRNPARLTDKYPNAYSDFYGSGTPCVYKTSPKWPVREGPEAKGIVREARPVYRHPIGPIWLDIGQRIIHALDSGNIKWTSINPLAYANAGEARPFCPFILSIGVVPRSLLYGNAVRAANVVKSILSGRGFSKIEVAFVESISTRSVTMGPKLLPFDPLRDDVPELRKPFTPALGLAISPLKHVEHQGTGALYFRLPDRSVALLTCAHVARPISAFPNTGMSYSNNSQPREEIVALGNKSYNNATHDIMERIGNGRRSIQAWENMLHSLGEPSVAEPRNVTQRRKNYSDLVVMTRAEIDQADELHTLVTKRNSNPHQRVIGFVWHSEKIESAGPCNFTKDLALIKLYEEKIDWPSFKGNKVYVGMS